MWTILELTYSAPQILNISFKLKSCYVGNNVFLFHHCCYACIDIVHLIGDPLIGEHLVIETRITWAR